MQLGHLVFANMSIFQSLPHDRSPYRVQTWISARHQQGSLSRAHPGKTDQDQEIEILIAMIERVMQYAILYPIRADLNL